MANRPCAKCLEAPRAPNHAYCRECRNAYQNAYRKRRYHNEPAYRHGVKVAQQIRRYGLTDAAYTELWAQQGGVCAICFTESEKRPLAVDHCHTSGRIRGLLCDRCNGAIGMFRESPTITRNALAYMEANA